FGKQFGLAGVGQPAGEPDAVDVIRVFGQQCKYPLEIMRLGLGVEIVAFVVKALVAGGIAVREVVGGLVQMGAILGESDAGRVNRHAAAAALFKAVRLDQRQRDVNGFPMLFVVAGL